MVGDILRYRMVVDSLWLQNRNYARYFRDSLLKRSQFKSKSLSEINDHSDSETSHSMDEEIGIQGSESKSLLETHNHSDSEASHSIDEDTGIQGYTVASNSPAHTALIRDVSTDDNRSKLACCLARETNV